MSSKAEKVQIRPVQPEDRDQWAHLRRALFPDFDAPEIDEFFKTGRFDGFEQCEVFVAETTGALVGFAEASARPYADGCKTTPVAYLEAWYVAPEVREEGVGKLLVAAVEEWGRSMGFQEIASDADINNHLSHKAHQALGFAETDRIVCFAKKL